MVRSQLCRLCGLCRRGLRHAPAGLYGTIYARIRMGLNREVKIQLCVIGKFVTRKIHILWGGMQVRYRCMHMLQCTHCVPGRSHQTERIGTPS